MARDKASRSAEIDFKIVTKVNQKASEHEYHEPVEFHFIYLYVLIDHLAILVPQIISLKSKVIP